MLSSETLLMVVAGATTLIRRAEIRLPPLIPIQYATARRPSPRSPVLLPRLHMESSESGGSSGSESDINVVEAIQNRTLFVCGFVNKRWHNSSLQSLIYDLIPHYYVACNDDNDQERARTRELLSHADAIIFFVNEFTLGDMNCLLTLQYAWQIMVPIIMLRPPRTKLVLCKRSNRKREDMRVVGSGSIIRSPSSRWALVEEETSETVDYNLLQDILYEGYKLSVVYDRLEHNKSMTRIKERINSVLRPEPFVENSSKAGFYLSPSNESSASVTITTQSSVKNKIRCKRSAKKSSVRKEMRMSQSLNNLESQKSPVRDRDHKKKVPGTPRKPRNHQLLLPGNSSEDEKDLKSPSVFSSSDQMEDVLNGNDREEEDCTPTPLEEKEKPAEVKRQLSTGSRQISLERRLSLSSLDDRRNFTNTQYLLFPLRDPMKKPQLIRFPDDLLGEQWKDESVWGSDTSLDEEVEIAPRINAGLSLDEEDCLSPTYSPAPAPYIDPI